MGEDRQMLISVALATYNGEKYIPEQLDSFLNQSVQDFELVVCDDCSTDATVKILNEYAEKDSRIKVFVNEENLGFKKNFEKAISLCSGDYIALSDQDDIWSENHLQVLVENIGSKDLVGANAFLCDENANPTGADLLSCSRIDFLPQTKDDWFFFLLHSNIFQGAACLFRKSLAQNALPIPENVKFHDYWLALVASVNGGVTYVNECILYYRQHGMNITENSKWNFWKRIENRKNADAYSDMKLKTLLALKEKFSLQQNNLRSLEKAVLYHRGFLLFSIEYFIKNYRWIYLSKKKTLFLLRFFNILTKGL